MGRCFLTNMLDDKNINSIVEKNLHNKMTHLINKIRGGNGEYGVNKYLSENPKSDPNAYEIVDVLTAYNNLVALGKELPEDIKKDLDNMFYQRKQNFIENGIGTDSASYRICEFCYKPENLDDYPLPAVTIATLRKIASLDLYSRQQIRDNGLLFDNVSEVETVLNYFKASNDVKPGYLDMFKLDLANIYNMARKNREKSNDDFSRRTY